MNDPITSKDLLRCPHCRATTDGGVVRVASIWEDHEDCCEVQLGHGNSWCVVCDAKIGGCGAAGGYDMTEEKAIAKWNRRAAHEPCAEPAAWMADDGRVITAASKTQAVRDGGAVAAATAVFSIPLFRASQPPGTSRCNCGAHDWPDDCIQIEDSCGRLHTLRGCQPTPTKGANADG